MTKEKNAPEKPTEFDHHSIYNKEIQPLLNQIKKICKLNGIPFAASFAVANTPAKTKYENEAVLPGSNEIVLTDDMFRQYVMTSTL